MQKKKYESYAHYSKLSKYAASGSLTLILYI